MVNNTELFFREIVGLWPGEPGLVTKTADTLEWLQDSGTPEEKIIRVIFSYAKTDYQAITPENLPDFIWENSLMQRGRFYYHHALRLTRKTGMGRRYNNYLEMRAGFSMEDLLDYFHRAFSTDSPDREKERTQFSIMLKGFGASADDVQGLDLVLRLIDDVRKNTADSFSEVYEPFDLRKSGLVSLSRLYIRRHMAEAKLMGRDRVIWRKSLPRDISRSSVG